MKGALVLVALLACGEEAAKAVDTSAGVPRREAKVVRGDLAERVLVTGQLRAGASVNLTVPKTEVWELTIRWMAEDGAAVKAGDKVLEFDNSSFTEGLQNKKLQVLEAESTLAVSRDLATMTAAVKDYELRAHRVALDKSKLMASVPADLMPLRTAQERQLDKSRMEAAVTRAEQELATEKQASALESRVKQIELDKAKRAIQSAEQGIAELTLAAPRDGVVLIGTHPWMGKRFQIGDTVQPGFTIVTLPEVGKPMKVRAELSDVDDGKLAIGMKGTCTLDAYPKQPLACVVEELAPVARTNNRESLRRVFSVTFGLDKDEEWMRPGMSVKVEVLHPPAKGVLLVPRGAVVGTATTDKPARVRTPGGDKDVKLGACDAQRCIVEGLAEGDTVLEGL